MLCRGLPLMLERAGAIQLPAARRDSPNRPEGPERPEPLAPDNRPVRGPLGELGLLEFQRVRRTPQEALFNSLMEQYHYLQYRQPVGEHLKYLVSAKGQVIACLAWCSAPRHLANRDRFIGWSAEARKRNLRLLAYNTRFLILPWVAVPHLASRILGRMAKIVPRDWQQMYAHPVYWLETFIDPARFKGTCYRAANWQRLGTTTGRGHNAPTKKRTQPGERVVRSTVDAALSQTTESVMKMKAARRRIEVNLEELDRIIDHGTRAPLSESDGQKIEAALPALADRLTPKRSTEKTSAVLPKPAPKPAAPADGED
jgi:hypothetical protein